MGSRERRRAKPCRAELVCGERAASAWKPPRCKSREWVGSPALPGRNPSVFVLRSSSRRRHRQGTKNKTCANSPTRRKGKAKGVKETKERFPNFPFLFSPPSLSTLKGLSEADVGAARGRCRHWLPGSGALHIGGYKSGGGARRRSGSSS